MENGAGWTTLSESTMGTILRLVGRHLPLTTTRHLQKLTRTSGQEVAAATEHSADFRIFPEDARQNVTDRLVLSIYVYMYRHIYSYINYVSRLNEFSLEFQIHNCYIIIVNNIDKKLDKKIDRNDI